MNSKHPLYYRYREMNRRCYDPNRPHYKYYGAKGVTVCARWHKNNPDGLINFIADMEASYLTAVAKHGKVQLDKDILAIPGQPKLYSPDTCCWVSHSENMTARRYSKIDINKTAEIRKLYKETNLTHRALAKMFNVGRSTIGRIVNS